MPKKSKREKILAEARRRVRTEHVLTASPAPSPIAEHTHTFQFKAPSLQGIPARTGTSDGTELTAIKKDLSKTIILAGIAIAAELVLYWFGK